ncbi:MAG TPA: D-TA family PLP-dependent enzyme [Verrucomicrobiae bacterium]|nr:D-TA family PLP-dependent enzyme [Verrucomicrobiae bacterium]
MSNWYEVKGARELDTPSLLIYRERLEYNVSRMLEVAGGPPKLRPHIKTHKSAEIIKLQLARGITKFKCATLAEAAMAASIGAPDVLVAYQPVGPASHHLAHLIAAFPRTQFSTIADDADAILGLSRALASHDVHMEVLVDLDLGQHRTGVAPGSAAIELYRLIASTPALKPGGLHAYDGHIGDTDLKTRISACEAAFSSVASLRRELEAAGLPVPRVVVGGSPTFPIHARRSDVECSPGTCVFWDAGYLRKLPDQDFKPAALVLTRVVSKPGTNRLCLDLGHKAIASEMPHPRMVFLNLPEASAVAHNEEHLVVETSEAARFAVGAQLYALPWHICPTVALHSSATVIEHGQATACWPVSARDRAVGVPGKG